MTTSAITHARGLAAQLQRVNESPSRLLERIADLERERDRLRQLLADARAELTVYRDHDLGDSQPEPSRTTLMHNGRPAATAAQIARQHNVNISNVYRQLQCNKLAGAQVNGHWIIYLDQSISFKSYRRKS